MRSDVCRWRGREDTPRVLPLSPTAVHVSVLLPWSLCCPKHISVRVTVLALWVEVGDGHSQGPSSASAPAVRYAAHDSWAPEEPRPCWRDKGPAGQAGTPSEQSWGAEVSSRWPSALQSASSSPSSFRFPASLGPIFMVVHVRLGRLGRHQPSSPR